MSALGPVYWHGGFGALSSGANVQDTLFTDRLKINFLKNPFDTIEEKHFQKILKTVK